MDELWLRAGVVAGAIVISGAVAIWRRRRAMPPARDIAPTGLDAGVYLFTSSSCPTCRSARSRVVASVGREGFTEFPWEQDPGVFADLGVDAVPAVLVVDESGDGRLHPGALRHVVARL